MTEEQKNQKNLSARLCEERNLPPLSYGIKDERTMYCNESPGERRVREAREERERLERKITPELLSIFDENDAFALVQYFNRTPSITTCQIDGKYDLNRLSDPVKEFLTKELHDKRIIELGNKGWKSASSMDELFGSSIRLNPKGEIAFQVLRFGARSYEGCDPKYNEDGLSYLMRQADESAIVCSFGVLEDGVLYGPPSMSNLRRYSAELAKQIYRVTPKGAITFHGLEYTRDLEEAGFTFDDIAPGELRQTHTQNQMSFGRLVVMRRKEND